MSDRKDNQSRHIEKNIYIQKRKLVKGENKSVPEIRSVKYMHPSAGDLGDSVQFSFQIFNAARQLSHIEAAPCDSERGFASL